MRIRFLLVTCLWLFLVLSFSSVSLAPPSWVCETGRGFFGVGEPLLWRSVGLPRENLNISLAFEKMEYLNVCRLREWVWRCLIFDENGTGLNQTAADKLNEIVTEAQSRNITVMGMVQDFPRWMTGIGEYEDDRCVVIRNSVPKRNFTEGSSYLNFLEKYAWSWRVLAEAFPDITLWEIGNEYNLGDYLDPQGYANEDERSRARVLITMDLLYFGSTAIHEANNSTTVLGGLGGLDDLNGIQDFLESLYDKIENVTCHPYTNSTDPDLFFQVASWHPYLSHTPPDQVWLEENERIHDVMVNHNDGDGPVVFSEFGYSDNSTGLNRSQVASFLKEIFTIAKNLSWLEAIYWFRLIDPDPSYDTSYDPKEYGFGLMTKDLEIKVAGEEYKVIEEFSDAMLPTIMVVLIASVVVLPRVLYRRKSALGDPE